MLWCGCTFLFLLVNNQECKCWAIWQFSCVTFGETTRLFSKVATPFYPPPPAGPRYLGSVASPLPSGCQPRAHPLQPDSADAPHPGSALATPMRAAVGSFRRDLRRRAKASRRGVVVARSLRSRGAPDGSRGLRPERWSKSPALVRAPGCFRIARGRGRQSLYFTACTPWGQNDLCSFPRQTVQHHSNPSLCPDQ